MKNKGTAFPLSTSIHKRPRHFSFFILHFSFIAVVACGGVSDEPAAPAPLATGSGRVAAPDGVEIAYTVSGAGFPALVFIHGWMCDQTFWSAQVEAFSATNTVVTLDLPGHGLSGMDREGWPLMAYGADVRTVVEALDLTDVVLIGHSMGGPVALEAARLMPDRTRGVIAVDSLQDADARYDPDRINAVLAAYEKDFVGTCLQFTSSMFLDSADPALVEQVTNDMCDHSPEIAIALLQEFFSYELGPALATVSVPVRYINATSYPTKPEVNLKYQPDFSGVIVQDVGHFLMMEKPEVFNELLRQTVAGLG